MKRVTVLLCLFYFANSSDILAFFPISYNSHYIFVKPLLAKLAERGHNLTVYTVFPDKIPPTKYREIDIKSCMPTVPSSPVDQIIRPRSMLSQVIGFQVLIPKSTEVLRCPELVEILNSTRRFDLFLSDFGFIEWYAGFSYKFQVPMINITPNMVFPLIAYNIGATCHPAFIPNYLSRVAPKMTFMERLHNTYVYLLWMSIGHFYLSVPSNNIAREVFGDIPPLVEIVKNTSMTFVNSQPPYHVSYPTPPNLVQIAGMNIVGAKKLPQGRSVPSN